MALTLFAGSHARADNMVSIAITPATGVVTLVPHWSIGDNLAGFHHMSQDLGLTGSVANNFYSIKGTTIPSGGDPLAFNFYVAGSGSATPHADIGSKLTPDSYSALTSADPDIGYGTVNLYFIHHKGTTDYFAAIIPGSASASAITDLKPMSGPGGPATLGASGYFGLTFAAANLGYGLNLFYYLRTDPATGYTKFGTLEPALLGTSADQFDLGLGGHKALAFTGTDVGYGTDKMYYLRLDPITGFTIFGTLHPVTGRASDIANLGSVYSTLTFVPGDVGFGIGHFYATGAVSPMWQSVSFAAINDRLVGAGSFTVTPSASSGLPIELTVTPDSTGAATISGPVAGVFTVTPTAAGRITLQATQAGQAGLYEYNMLRQSFTATGATPGRLVNLSIRTTAGSGFETLIVGFVTEGGTEKASLLVRAAGPALSAHGVIGVLADPSLSVHNAVPEVIQTNNNWASVMSDSFAQVGAFPWTVGSKDSALILVRAPAPYTAAITGAGNGTGIVLVEIYDLNTSFNAAKPKLVNASARTQVNTGGDILIAGFVIDGDSPQQVLIRAVGPTLGNYGVTGALADPQLAIFSGQTQIGSNDDWNATLATIFAQTGAFPLTPSSKDAALLVTLPPGVYTAQASGVGDTTGVALIEVYAVPAGN